MPPDGILSNGDLILFDVTHGSIPTYGIAGGGLEFKSWMRSAELATVLGRLVVGKSTWYVLLFSFGVRVMSPSRIEDAVIVRRTRQTK